MQRNSNIREYVLISALGSALGFASYSAYYAIPDVWSTFMVQYKFQLDGGFHSRTLERYSEGERKWADFYGLCEKASHLAILKACVEHGPAGAVVGGVLGFAIVETIKRMRKGKQVNNAS